MRVDRSIQAHQIADAAPTKVKGHHAHKTKSADEDAVNISSAAQTLVNSADAARLQKVEALKRAVESGSYRVEPDKVAGAMVSSMLPPGTAEEK
ncbi:MAG: hypothetical protein NVS9B15_23680 [Acidobacteriaceae bacterium]